MDRVESDKKANLEVKVWKEYADILKKQVPKMTIEPVYLERFEFYERAKKAYAIIQCG